VITWGEDEVAQDGVDAGCGVGDEDEGLGWGVQQLEESETMFRWELGEGKMGLYGREWAERTVAMALRDWSRSMGYS
jgi:hypothetical protein